MRPQRSAPPGRVSRVVAQLRRRPPLGAPAAYRVAGFDLGITHFDLANNYGPPYNPTTAAFTSVDPDLTATNQAYAYADDNPLDGTDPTGVAARGIRFG
jgi:hypothetical protein